MKELDLDKRPEKQVRFGGQIYMIKPLKVRDQKQMQVALKGLDSDSPEYFDVVLSHIEKCGIPKAVIEDMDGDQLKSFIEFLGDQKKS